MTTEAGLLEAYKAIFLLELRRKITRGERIARIVALRDSPLAAGLPFEERNDLANEAVKRAAGIIDEVHFGPGSRWQ